MEDDFALSSFLSGLVGYVDLIIHLNFFFLFSGSAWVLSILNLNMGTCAGYECSAMKYIEISFPRASLGSRCLD